MLSLLTPAALWLLPLVAAPLVLHFLGRPQPEPRDFPSLLAVRESLREAMRRHRVKNWLQLILRMLILICLALAAAGPVWRPDGTLPPPDAALVLRHNGAYAELPLDPDDVHDPAGGVSAFPTVTTGAAQRIRTLESLTRGNTVTEPVIAHADASAGTETDAVDRHGNPREAMARLLRRADDAAGTRDAVEVHVEVFDATDLAAITEQVLPWLETRPQARLVLLDRSRHAHRLHAFGPPRVRVDPPEAPGRVARLTLEVPVAPEVRRVPVWIPHGVLGEGAPRASRWTDGGDGGIASFTLPLPDSGWVAGTFRLAEDDPARTRHAFIERAVAVEIPPAGDLCRTTAPAAAALAASLGRGGSRLRPRVVSRPEDAGGCRVLALADPSDAELPLAPAARAVVRRGGLVVFEAGPRTSIAAWNRALLEPLGSGRLTLPLEVGEAGRGTPVEPHAPGLARAGLQTTRWGSPGVVRRVIGFRAASEAETDTLLAARADGPCCSAMRRTAAPCWCGPRRSTRARGATWGRDRGRRSCTTPSANARTQRRHACAKPPRIPWRAFPTPRAA